MLFEHVRKSGEEWNIGEEEFRKRYRNLFNDPAFDPHQEQIEELANIAWNAYEESRKSPRTLPAGSDYADPDYALSVDWSESKKSVEEAQKIHEDPMGPPRVLLICASDRNDQTCPGEISKTYRLAKIAQEILIQDGNIVELLNLSKMTSEFGKHIYPCKGCVSTAEPLCHWPCSCYPNHALGQVNDWMNEIYPMWVRAHGIMIITPVYWHQAPSALKLMIDRLVCADGGNPDPTTTQGKDPKLAKQIEMDGWDYPRHLKGRVYSVVVHGDTIGVDELKNALSNWLDDMTLIPAGVYGSIGRYIGYYGPYAKSHSALDKDQAVMKEVEIAAKSLSLSVSAERLKKLDNLVPNFSEPRPK